MKLGTPLVSLVAVSAVLACSASVQKSPPADRVGGGGGGGGGQQPATPTPPPPGAPKGALGPAGEKAALFREAADQLDKAAEALQRGNKNLAEQLFSTAELLVGPEAVASIAPTFREGAPPRVVTPTVKVDTTAPRQPMAAGNSEEEDEAAKVPPPP